MGNYYYLTEHRVHQQSSGSAEQPLQTSFASPESVCVSVLSGLVIVVLSFNSVFYLFCITIEK